MKPSPLLVCLTLSLVIFTIGSSVALALPMDRPAPLPHGWIFGGCPIDSAQDKVAQSQSKNSEFTVLCARDDQCFHLKNYSPTTSERAELSESGMASGALTCALFKEPSPLLLEYLASYSYEFYEAAKLYDVPEAALIGSILAENTLNVSLDDKIQDKLASISGGFETPFSIGLGQVFPARAREVEQMSAWIEKRPTRSDSEIQATLLTERGSIFYVAAILRDAQKTYRRHGLDIRDNIPVLATLYNLGGVEDRAKQASSVGSTPRENYFGFFVRHHRPIIESLRLFSGMRPMEGQ